MPLIPINVVGPDTTYEELREEFAKLQKNLDYLLNGKMDDLNVSELNADVLTAGSITTDKIVAGAITGALIAIGAVGDSNIADAAVIASKIAAGAVIASKIAAGAVTADKISVSQLSAIAADLGTITAGFIQSVQIIGSYIATANGTYPRIELSSASRLLNALSDSLHYVSITPSASGSGPGIQWTDNVNLGYLAYLTGFGLLLQTFGTNQNISLSPQGNLALNPGGSLTINGTNGFNGEFLSGSLRVVVTKGIITSVS